MKAYIALWFNHAVLNTTEFVLWMMWLADGVWDYSSLQEARIAVAASYFLCAILINAISLDLMILYFYYRHSIRLSQQAKEKISERIKSEMIQSDNTSTRERLAAKKRMEVWKELADAQISEIVNSVLAMKVVDESVLESSFATKHNLVPSSDEIVS